MKPVMVRHKVQPDLAVENEELVTDVYNELLRRHPDGLRSPRSGCPTA